MYSRTMHRTLVRCFFAMVVLGCASSPTPSRPTIASDRDLDAVLPQLSNWGRWGRADELGTLNYLTAAAVRDARNLVTEGKTISLARPVTLAGNEGIRRAEYEMLKDESGTRDYLGGIWHGFAQTHLDALCHAFTTTGEMYNGVATSEVTAAGCGKLGIGAIAERGVAGRGVLLDVGALHGGSLEPGTAIMTADLEAAACRQGVVIRSGDIHAIAIPYLGLPLVDNAELDPLAAACAARSRWDFMLVIAPWRMTGATSSPVNPIAIF